MIRGKMLVEWVAVTAVCGCLAWVASHQQWLWRFDVVLYDTALSYRSAAPDPDIVIVAIDDRSLSDIGRWPWSRAVHAALIERLEAAGVRVVAFDVILHERTVGDALADEVLAQRIARHGRVVLPVTYGRHAADGDGESLPAGMFREAAAVLGHIHIELDPDGIARSLYLWEGLGEPRHPQLALAALQLAEPERATTYPAPAAQASGGWRRAGWFHIPFLGPPGSFRYVSYGDVLRGEVPSAVLRDAVVFVGSSAVGLGDMVPSPTSGHASLMPGVEVHATVYHALRHGHMLQHASLAATAAFNLLVVLLLMVAMLRLRPRAAMLAAFGMAVLALSLSWSMLQYAMLWLPPSVAVLVCLLAYPLWSWRRLEASRRYFERELDALHQGEAGPPGPRLPVVLDPFVERIEVLHQAAQRQRDMARSRDETLDFLSHDLRSPLAAILTTLDTAREHAAAGGTDVVLQRVGRYARNALDLAEKLVRLIRAESIDPERFSELNLELVVQDAADEAWAAARARDVELVSALGSGDGRDPPRLVRGDGELLRRAVLNLLDNAVKYSPPGGRVLVTLTSDAAGWVIEVRDAGPGIAEEDQVRLFKRFVRLPSPDGEGPAGVGLGLLMVRTVAERHGGSVSVASAPGQGACFRIHLPVLIPLDP